MTEWVTAQLELLRAQWPGLEYNPAGHWVRIPDWQLPKGWNPSVVDIAFQIKESIEQPPYAFLVNVPDIKFKDIPPGNWSTGAQVCFPGTWSQFSWSPEGWAPTVDPSRGPNMVEYVHSFNIRFEEGA